jgi:hypothetical protein
MRISSKNSDSSDLMMTFENHSFYDLNSGPCRTYSRSFLLELSFLAHHRERKCHELTNMEISKQSHEEFPS